MVLSDKEGIPIDVLLFNFWKSYWEERIRVWGAYSPYHIMFCEIRYFKRRRGTEPWVKYERETENLYQVKVEFGPHSLKGGGLLAKKGAVLNFFFWRGLDIADWAPTLNEEYFEDFIWSNFLLTPYNVQLFSWRRACNARYRRNLLVRIFYQFSQSCHNLFLGIRVEGMNVFSLSSRALLRRSLDNYRGNKFRRSAFRGKRFQLFGEGAREFCAQRRIPLRTHFTILRRYFFGFQRRVVRAPHKSFFIIAGSSWLLMDFTRRLRRNWAVSRHGTRWDNVHFLVRGWNRRVVPRGTRGVIRRKNWKRLYRQLRLTDY